MISPGKLACRLRKLRVTNFVNVCSSESFQRVQNWLAEVKQFARSEATYMIFGNKNDLEDKGQR